MIQLQGWEFKMVHPGRRADPIIRGPGGVLIRPHRGTGGAGATEPKPCPPGFVRDEKTGKCVKIVTKKDKEKEVKVFRNPEGRPSGVELPGGRVFFGLSPAEVREIAERERLKRETPAGAVEIGPTKQEVKAKQLEEGTAARRAEEEERREGEAEGGKFFDVQRDIVEPFKAGLPQSPGQLALDVATVTGISAAGRFVLGTGKAGAKGLGEVQMTLAKNSITKSRGRLASLDKGTDRLKMFGFNLGIKEMIFVGAVYSQRRVGNFVSDISTQATTMGTEKNEKVAREMISGLDPDTAIRIYESDIAVLRDSEQTLQFIKIFFIADYIGLKVENTQLNIRNQIDGKLSRIAEAERFKFGLNIQDIQANLNAEESVDKNEI